MKQKIREKLLKKRSHLSREDVIDKSKRIHRRLLNTKQFTDARIIMFYMPKDNEVDTRQTISLAIRKGKTVCLPYIDKDSHMIYPAIIRNMKKDIAKGTFGILEPRRKTSRPKKIDIIIVPGAAFDTECRRLGRGKAYYDRFLKNKKDIPRIGLGFDFQIVKKLPENIYDIPMDIVITEKKIIKGGTHI